MVFLEHVTITVPRVRWEETITFYQSVMGLELVLSVEGGKHVFLDGGDGALLGFSREDAATVIPNDHHLGFFVSTDRWNDLLAAIREAGADVEDVQNAGTGASYTFFNDPAGTRIQLLKRPGPIIDRFAY
jgi:catechol 2,3-dioxygenase-like lactoylglutathione lyase family enzyme